MNITVIQNTLTNPDKVNAAGWGAAQYTPRVVATRAVAPGAMAPMSLSDVLELAFFKTQHIDSVWFKDEFWEHAEESRSSMVGDWIVVDDETYEIADVGFEKVEEAW